MTWNYETGEYENAEQKKKKNPYTSKRYLIFSAICLVIVVGGGLYNLWVRHYVGGLPDRIAAIGEDREPYVRPLLLRSFDEIPEFVPIVQRHSGTDCVSQPLEPGVVDYRCGAATIVQGRDGFALALEGRTYDESGMDWALVCDDAALCDAIAVDLKASPSE
ncbi:hypothetical protein DW322_19665 [Rhodococcus rhodnii]|uniref:Uncharacterized protein n=2 Tax=Rhodococcus rhodnii TaxID=38312 RepID=R7WPJ2_9NOCA|nr:hypothetical protein [Rhodococcus rhodnii]EOM77228.1 hypothetical protein Rrhod_1476 [Rhodococcus rhodnii LMG 5362]TXG91987.1 hypothetical protein DW322_19665 [Rhodococcus rhodnii]